jgi:hypothetical protein
MLVTVVHAQLAADTRDGAYLAASKTDWEGDDRGISDVPFNAGSSSRSS